MQATHNVTVHMDIEADRYNSVGWVRRVEINLADDGVDVQTDPITVAQAVEITGERERILTQTADTIAMLRDQEATYEREIAAGLYADPEDERHALSSFRDATDRLAAEFADAYGDPLPSATAH
jgi:hypothetical protein